MLSNKFFELNSNNFKNKINGKKKDLLQERVVYKPFEYQEALIIG
jgi:hypothetical protein